MTALFDSITLIASVGTVFILILGWKRSALFATSKPLLLGLAVFAMLYAACLLVEWAGISTAYDDLEDYIGIAIPVWWIAVFYALHQEVNSADLAKSRERLHLALEGANEGLWDYAPLSGAIHFSPRWFTMLGYPVDAFPHSMETWEQLVHPGDRHATLETIRRFLDRRTDEYSAEFRMMAADGMWRWIHARGKAAAWDERGEIVRMVGTHVDITRQKESEQALRDSEEQYRILFESAQNATLTLSPPDWKFSSANPAAMTLFGLEDVGRLRQSSLLTAAPPRQPDGRFSEAVVTPFLDAALREGASRGTWWLSKRDGTAFLGEVVLTRVTLRNDVFLLATIRDITRESELEEQLRQAQKMEAVGRLAGGVAHDFNNLLQVISGYGALVQDDLGSDETHQNLDEVLKAAERARILVAQLLAFGRRTTPAPELIDLNAATEDVLRMLRRVLGEQIRIDFQRASESVSVRADRGMLEQVLVNLCVNARDAMSDGGTLSVLCAWQDMEESACQTVGLAVPGRYAVLRVADTGTGMDPVTRDRVFEPFFTTKAEGKGTGLGMATVYGIVTQHQGAVHCESTLGLGTRFDVYLPIAGEAAKGTAAAPAPAAAGGSETVLLVEDEEMVRTLAIRLLERAGYTVESASNGREAVEKFEAAPGDFDVVLLDVVMPEMGGREAFDRIRAIRPDIPAVFASGYSDSGVDAEVLATHGVALISKPYSNETLLATLRSILSSSTQSRT